MDTTNSHQFKLNHFAKNMASRIVVGLIVFPVLGVVGYRGFIHAKIANQRLSCQESLWLLEGWKRQYALERNIPSGTQIGWDDYVANLEVMSSSGYLKTPETRECPSGHGIRVINPVGTDAICTSGLLGHNLAEALKDHPLQ